VLPGIWSIMLTWSEVLKAAYNQLTSLLDTLSSSAAHFIRCVVPNYERVPGKIDGPLVLNQLRYVLLLSSQIL
ncbi:hypothetical protein ANCDUO_25433, partial [Ancylostoma duodenale]